MIINPANWQELPLGTAFSVNGLGLGQVILVQAGLTQNSSDNTTEGKPYARLAYAGQAFSVSGEEFLDIMTDRKQRMSLDSVNFTITEQTVSVPQVADDGTELAPIMKTLPRLNFVSCVTREEAQATKDYMAVSDVKTEALVHTERVKAGLTERFTQDELKAAVAEAMKDLASSEVA